MKLIIICMLLTLNSSALAETGLTLTGRYEYRPRDELLGHIVCFYPNAVSAKRLPRPETDHRLPWFCFNNIAQAKKMLNISSSSDCDITGIATVHVSQYKVFLEATDGYDTAVLHSVKHNSNRNPISCNTQPDVATSNGLPHFEKQESYTTIRIKMIESGWKPFHSDDADTCLKADTRCEDRPEMESCTSTGLGNCRFLWEKNGSKKAICTIGDNAVFDGICD